MTRDTREVRGRASIGMSDINLLSSQQDWNSECEIGSILGGVVILR